jgi:UDP-N-acetylmuramoyl-L-alanyl-D-glutamate--2,6-diaminopimelate ligase
MKRNLKEIIGQLSVEKQTGDASREISAIVFDSRQAGADTLFVAQRGTVADGHKYINQVFAAGCRAVLCEEMPTDIPADATVIEVKDTHAALGIVASAFYGNPSEKLKLVGVTGTNGKTTTATLLYEMAGLLGHKAGLFSTVVNYIGTRRIEATHTTPDAVTLNKMMSEMVSEGCDYCFMEVSSHSVDQKRIAGLTFNGGIFSNITHDHLDYHKTFSAYIKAKKGFFDSLPSTAFALTNADDKNGMVMLQNCKAVHKSYSIRSAADFKARIIEHSFEGMQLLIDGVEVWTPFVGEFNVQNLLAVYGSCIMLGFEKDKVLVELSRLVPVSGRFETVRSADGVTAIVDYAHTPDALRNVITTINEIREPHQQFIAVVGAGGDRDATKRPLMAAEAVAGCSKVILTSDNPRSEEPSKILDDMLAGVEYKDRIKVITIENRREAIKTAVAVARPGDIILIAGKGHETYQEIKGQRHHFDDREVVKECFFPNK